MDDLEDLKKKYQAEIEKLESEDLIEVAESREKALELARKGIEQVEPDKLTPEHIESIANEMQVVAKMILEERSKN